MYDIHISQSQSQSSIILEDVTHRSQENSKEVEIPENPFLKKNSSDNNAKKLEINEHIAKFGIVKKKVEDRRK